MGLSRDRINLWLEAVRQELEQPLSNISEAALDSRRTQLYALDSAETRKESHILTVLLSPPTSLKRPRDNHDTLEMAQQWTPKKRKRDKDASSVVEDDAAGLDDTPRANPPPSVLGSDVPSLSSQSSSVVSGQSSPSRLIDQLRLHPKGGEIKTMNINDENMPLSLAEFVLDMQRVVKYKVVPAHLEEDISRRKRSIRSLLEFDRDVYTSPSVGAQSPSPIDTCTLDDILQIVKKSKDTANLKQDKAARILPQYRIQNLPGKKVDYTLVIDPKLNPESEAAIDALWTARKTINHTDFTPLQKLPVAVSIETKRTNQNLDKANLQMNVWQAAQWRLLEELAGATALEELEFLPGILVQGHKWEFVASSYQDGRTILWTERTLGSTQSEMGVFQILAGISRLRQWALKIFWP
ncbi:hypothetical protein NM208_g4684 [Fusarium decemcellulare]|uniref:Uncharacterized protein n=2 Tax=Fusarium decemcellulare TaxID=57161 RepID=A0ACC1S6A9_9HYPO|nr:hypothetical protein NM208_g8192 [Fusarium decemcellulare]KAJ3541284.1 hypothetical protein NM208_g4684 [Fusarium decemcellulare]